MSRIGEGIARKGLLADGQKVVVAVSGGVDSMVLLHLLAELAPDRRWRLHVAHFNHLLRGRHSQADQRLVVAAARRLGLPYTAGEARVSEVAAQEKISIEMAARTMRHGFLAEVALREGAFTVALAHHHDDQVELFFLRLLRGSGGVGLAGIRARAPSPADSRVELIRPLLDLAKVEIEAHARQAEIPFRADTSNQSLEFARNRIRNRLLPLLREEYQPALDRVVGRAMEILGAEHEAVVRAARDWRTSGMRPDFQALPMAVQRVLLQEEMIRLGWPPSFEAVEALRLSPAPLSRACGVFLRHDGRGKLATGQTSGRFRREVIQVLLEETAQPVEFSGAKLWWKRVAGRGRERGAPRPGREVFDADRVGERVELRHWRPGDRFQPIGMAQTVKLQDLFTNAKIPRDHRHRGIVASTAQGEIFWVEGLRIGERFKLGANSGNHLIWRWARP